MQICISACEIDRQCPIVRVEDVNYGLTGDVLTISAAQAAKYLGVKSSWTLTNLSIQKLLYIAHMVFLGENDGLPLISEYFEAWDYGPVVPEVYHRIKMFGNEPAKDVFYFESNLDQNTPEGQTLARTVNVLSEKPASELVSITHWKNGAWARHYTPGRRGVRIPNSDILAEFKARISEHE